MSSGATKTCRGCGEDKPVEEFRWVHKTGHNPYRQSRCKDCESRARRKTDYDHDAAVAEARSKCSDPELLRWPATAAEARRLGVNKCFTGLPCVHGHIGLRWAKDSSCVRCGVDISMETHRQQTREAQRQREADRQAAWGGNCPWPATPGEARRIGTEFYFTGVACVRGHIQIRETASERCTDCPTDADRHRQRLVEEGTESVLAEQAAKAMEAYWSNPEKQRRRSQERRDAGVSGFKVHRLRTPPWQTDEEAAAIEAFYANCPLGHEVDHIVPIDHRKRLVGGLHVLANLQYLNRRQNVRKDIGVEMSREEAAALVAQGSAVWSGHIDAQGNVDWSHYWRDGQRVADGG